MLRLYSVGDELMCMDLKWNDNDRIILSSWGGACLSATVSTTKFHKKWPGIEPMPARNNLTH